MVKQCPRCGVPVNVKPGNRSRGYDYRCQGCKNARNRAYYLRNKTRLNARYGENSKLRRAIRNPFAMLFKIQLEKLGRF